MCKGLLFQTDFPVLLSGIHIPHLIHCYNKANTVTKRNSCSLVHYGIKVGSLNTIIAFYLNVILFVIKYWDSVSRNQYLIGKEFYDSIHLNSTRKFLINGKQPLNIVDYWNEFLRSPNGKTVDKLIRKGCL